LAELLGHVSAAIDRYRASEIDAYAVDETIHHYHRAAAELWKFCFARGGGAHAEFIAGLLDRPGHRPYARTTPNPGKQGRKHISTSSLPTMSGT
jgi:hypothetical protein